jgi:organic hydroperoxide reductase OsmC/OhrA
MSNQHKYTATVQWTGNTGKGTVNPKAYDRSHSIIIENKPVILGSSDPAFSGDISKHNPEDLLVSSLSACHMLWYLYLCAESGIVVVDYTDTAEGTMDTTPKTRGRFTGVTLNPVVTVTDESMFEKAVELHEQANELCFIANSVNFPVYHNPVIKLDSSNIK